jgi:hypothetical protein
LSSSSVEQQVATILSSDSDVIETGLQEKLSVGPSKSKFPTSSSKRVHPFFESTKHHVDLDSEIVVPKKTHPFFSTPSRQPPPVPKSASKRQKLHQVELEKTPKVAKKTVTEDLTSPRKTASELFQEKENWIKSIDSEFRVPKEQHSFFSDTGNVYAGVHISVDTEPQDLVLAPQFPAIAHVGTSYEQSNTQITASEFPALSDHPPCHLQDFEFNRPDLLRPVPSLKNLSAFLDPKDLRRQAGPIIKEYFKSFLSENWIKSEIRSLLKTQINSSNHDLWANQYGSQSCCKSFLEDKVVSDLREWLTVQKESVGNLNDHHSDEDFESSYMDSSPSQPGSRYLLLCGPRGVIHRVSIIF